MRQVGNISILPIRTKIRGPAPLGDIQLRSTSVTAFNRTLSIGNPNEADIIDETLDLFRANSLFRNFEIKGPSDRTLIVLILFVSDCLAKIGSARTVPTQLEASKVLNTLAVDTFPIPGDANFPLNAHYAPPQSRVDGGRFDLNSNIGLQLFHSPRLPTSIPHPNATRTGSEASGKALR